MIIQEILDLQKANRDLEILPNDISQNAAFLENLVTGLICNQCKIPLLIVGKPGSSKTLAIQVLKNLLSSDYSLRNKEEFYNLRHFTNNIFMPYWGSPKTTTQDVQEVFQKAEKNFNELNAR